MRKKELQASNLAETNASVIEAYEKYLRDKDADEKNARDQYYSVLLETLEGFIRHEIWERSKGQTYRLNASDKEDLYQAGAMAIFQDMLRYNPYESKAISFFGDRIRGAIRLEAGRRCPEFSTHYRLKAEEIARVVRNTPEFEGKTAQEIAPEILAEYTGLSLVTVRNTLAMMATHGGDSPYDPDAMASIADRNPTPEQAVLKKEMEEDCSKMLAKLSPYHRFLLVMTTGYNGHKYSIRQIEAMLKANGFYSKLGLTKIPDAGKIAKDINAAMARARQVAPTSLKSDSRPYIKGAHVKQFDDNLMDKVIPLIEEDDKKGS